MLALWRLYTHRGPPGENKAWWSLFEYLTDLRSWSPKDRIEVATVKYLQYRMQVAPDQPVRLELDLWFRGTDMARAGAVEQVSQIIQELGGTVLDAVTLTAIEYQALLVDISAEHAAGIAQRDGPLAGAAAVMSIRPQSLFEADAQNVETFEAESLPTIPAQITAAVAALIDGHVVGEHDFLSGRVDVIEIDVPGNTVPVSSRLHGTAMASLILHGDLAAAEPPLTRKLVVVPILESVRDHVAF